jgi:predicted adenylyl cyclase CyaB
MAPTRMPRAADYLGSAPMPRNVEIKAYIESVDLLARKTAAIADQGPIEIDQDDTFFYCEAGRLKLRSLSLEEGELIFYRRADQHGPKESYYLRSLTSAPETLRELLTQAYGQAARVQKHRTLFLLGRTRVHLDDVKFLGHFLEIEVVLEEGEPVEAGIGEARSVMARLGIETAQLIDGSYVDLLAQKTPTKQCAARDQGGRGI